jgi:hypothetical protein
VQISIGTILDVGDRVPDRAVDPARPQDSCRALLIYGVEFLSDDAGTGDRTTNRNSNAFNVAVS